MAGDDKPTDAVLQDLGTRVDGLAVDIQETQGRLEEAFRSSDERFDQIDLAQTATRTEFDTLTARLDAMHATLTELQKDYGGDTEADDGDAGRRGRARRVVRPPTNDSFAKIKFKIPPFMENMILLHILIGN